MYSRGALLAGILASTAEPPRWDPTEGKSQSSCGIWCPWFLKIPDPCMFLWFPCFFLLLGAIAALCGISLGFPGGSGSKEPTCQSGDVRGAGSISGSGRSPGVGHGNPLQYSHLENSMDRGAWLATVHRVAQSRTELKWVSKHARMAYFSSLMWKPSPNLTQLSGRIGVGSWFLELLKAVLKPWLILVNVWKKPLQYCKVISLQLTKKKRKKKRQESLTVVLSDLVLKVGKVWICFTMHLLIFTTL